MRALAIAVGIFLAAAIHFSDALIGATTAKETFAACRVADTASTIAILRAGGVEKNPIMAKAYQISPLAFVAFQIALTVYVLYQWNEYGEGFKVALNAISCAPALHNAGVIYGR